MQERHDGYLPEPFPVCFPRLYVCKDNEFQLKPIKSTSHLLNLSCKNVMLSRSSLHNVNL
jgi:hypothetical protein